MAIIDKDTVLVEFKLEMDSLKAQLSTATKEIEKLQETTKKSNFFTELNSKVSLATTGINAFIGTVRAIGGTLQEAGRIDGLVSSYETLSKSVGQDATEALDRLRASTQGLVSDLDLMTASNKAIQLNLPTEDFDKATAATIKLGRAMGIDAKQSIDDFTTGVGRGSVQILDNLGIIVKAEDAQKRYADSVGKTVNQLSESEKKLAFQKEAYRQVIESASRTADITDDTSAAYSKFEVAIDNARTKILLAINSNDDFRDAIKGLTQAVSEIDFDRLIDDLASVYSFLNDSVIPIVQKTYEVIQASAYGLGLLADAIDELAFSGLSREAHEFNDTMENVSERIANVNSQLRNLKTVEDFEALKKEFTGLANAVNSNDQIAETYEDTLRKLARRIYGINENELTKHVEVIKDVNEVTDKAKREAEEYAKQVAKLEDLISGRTRIALDNFKKGLEDLGVNSYDTLTKNRDEVLDLVRDYEKAGLSLSELGSKIEQTVQEGMQATEEQARLASEAILKLESDLSDIGGKALFNLFEGVRTGASAEELKEISEDIGKQLGGAIGAQFGTLGTLVGEKLGEKVAGQYFDIVDSIIRGNSGEIQKAIDSEIGIYLRSSLAALTLGTSEILFSLIGGKNAEANARRAVANFFNSAIDETGFFIQKFDDLGRDAFDPFLDSAGELTTKTTEIFKTLDADTQSFFSTLGVGLGQLFNIEDLNLSQFGELLGANFAAGTNTANDLQILLKQIGVDAEQLGEQLEESWDKGDISAREFLATTRATEELLRDGIPNATGAVGEALDNLAKNGLKSGAQAFDAIGDIGAEAMELVEQGTLRAGASLEELREVLIAQGKPIEKVDALMLALSQNGIANITQFGELTKEQAASIIVSLEDMGNFFTSTADDIEEYKGLLDQIQDKKVRIDVDIRTNTDAKTQQYQELITGDRGLSYV